MNTLSFLVGGLALLITLLFFSFIGLLWVLKQLLTIAQQNDTILILLNQISMNIWQAARMQSEPEEIGDTTPTAKRELTLHRQTEAYVPSEPRLASLK
jgi:hypothetical protein